MAAVGAPSGGGAVATVIERYRAGTLSVEELIVLYVLVKCPTCQQDAPHCDHMPEARINKLFNLNELEVEMLKAAHDG